MIVTAPRFEMSTIRNGYVDLCMDIRNHGRYCEPRGLPCRELTGVTVVVLNPTVDAMPAGVGRKLNLAIGAAEALQLIGGVSTPELLCRIAPQFKRFRDGEAFYGAYGPRVAAQLSRVRKQLDRDPDTRQAIATVWKPDDAWAQTRDLPCTLSFQFLLRGGLELHTTMRSNDVWLGWPYDAFQFTRLQQAMAASLGVPVGPYVHRAGSLHLYANDFEAVDALAAEYGSADFDPCDAELDAGEACDWTVMQSAARLLLEGHVVEEDVSDWYSRTLARHVDRA